MVIYVINPVQLLKPIYQATCPNCQSLIEFEMGTGGLKPARTINQEQTEIEEISLELIASHQMIVDRLIEVQQRTSRRPGWIFYQLKELESIESFNAGRLAVCRQAPGLHERLGMEGLARDPGFGLKRFRARIV